MGRSKFERDIAASIELETGEKPHPAVVDRWVEGFCDSFWRMVDAEGIETAVRGAPDTAKYLMHRQPAGETRRAISRALRGVA